VKGRVEYMTVFVDVTRKIFKLQTLGCSYFLQNGNGGANKDSHISNASLTFASLQKKDLVGLY
jgi:hypothetical protein